MRAELKIYFDRDDGISISEVCQIGASTLEDGIGETTASWQMRSREEAVKTLGEVTKFLSRSSRSK